MQYSIVYTYAHNITLHRERGNGIDVFCLRKTSMSMVWLLRMCREPHNRINDDQRTSLTAAALNYAGSSRKALIAAELHMPSNARASHWFVNAYRQFDRWFLLRCALTFYRLQCWYIYYIGDDYHTACAVLFANIMLIVNIWWLKTGSNRLVAV